ncbi:energy transducer TonB [Commensalibacter papalotli (ex Botero et al. 2024)]|uniref:Links inner and outer membranes (TonB) (PDB:1IHR) n=1 Tax=Commensalibacter papalotli (ex Botero et al. 2024) TaxID=2972766 RepID=A0ABM9HPT0_9PROT|nr:energy transducer TonB [Commensalibacter papalotli (ex Botero et al. 2024)]CAI3942950.1 Periplasmic protein TonB [Commensalibacter papalotli (ex Botero et al. 2024)]
MKQNDKPLQRKAPTLSPRDRYVGSIVSYPTSDSINPDLVSSLRPQYIKKSSKNKIIFAGFPLLRKESFRPESSLSLTKLKGKQTQEQTSAFTTTSLSSLKHNSKNLPKVCASGSLLQPTNNAYNHYDILYLAGSLTAHILVVAAIYIWYLVYPHPSTNGNSQQGQPVEVVFAPDKTGSSGLTGEGLTGEEGQPPPPPLASIPEISSPPPEEKSVEAPEPETEPLPDTGNVPLMIPKPQTQTPKKQPAKTHQYTYRYTPPRQQRRQQTAPKASDNPFANMQSFDFSENPNKSKRKAATHRLPQGSRSGIDMSTGPLVKNGKINVPYAAKISIQGVSDDYGAAINAWIRQHLYYPPDAANNGEDGSASVHVALNRDGYVLSVSLTGSSGSDALDTAITSMFRGAKLPKIPPDLPDHFELDLTVNYILLRR